MDMWRSRTGFIVKLAGLALIFVGAATIPTSIGSPRWGLSIFQYVEVLGIFLPVGIGLVVLGLILLAIGPCDFARLAFLRSKRFFDFARNDRNGIRRKF
jgi:hypothetical protein